MPLNEYLFNYFFITDLIDYGFIVQYWDLTKIYYPDLKYANEIDKSIVVKLNPLKKFKERLRNENLKNTIFFTYMGYDLKVLRLFRILTKEKATIIFFRDGLFPLPPQEKLIYRFVKKPQEYINFNRIRIFGINQIKKLTSLCKKMHLVKEFDFIFASGNIANSLNRDKVKTIPINLSDYDSYTQLKRIKNKILYEKYCVFHDEDFVSHPDIKIFGFKYINPNKYYQLLNDFFDRIEKKFNVKVIIGASPKANYDNNPFKCRLIFELKTAELVKDCEFSIVVGSTSVSYPILFQKPILFINTNDIAKNYGSYCKIPQYWASYLDCKYYMLDDIEEDDEIIINPVNKEKYDKYKYNYLTTKESENNTTKNIVINYLRNYFEKGSNKY